MNGEKLNIRIKNRRSRYRHWRSIYRRLRRSFAILPRKLRRSYVSGNIFFFYFKSRKEDHVRIRSCGRFTIDVKRAWDTPVFRRVSSPVFFSAAKPRNRVTRLRDSSRLAHVLRQPFLVSRGRNIIYIGERRYTTILGIPQFAAYRNNLIKCTRIYDKTD